jgi:hypothetical protein
VAASRGSREAVANEAHRDKEEQVLETQKLMSSFVEIKC